MTITDNPLGLLTGFLLFAVLVEAVITVINRAKTKYRDWQYWGSLAVAVFATVIYEIDLFESLGFNALIPFVGAVFTGIIISRGSNYVFDILKRVSNPVPQVVNIANGNIDID